jgi:hypothetical protein
MEALLVNRLPGLLSRSGSVVLIVTLSLFERAAARLQPSSLNPFSRRALILSSACTNKWRGTK